MYYLFIASTTFAIVPADLRSAGIYYKDLQIRLKYRLFKLKAGAKAQLKMKDVLLVVKVKCFVGFRS